MAMVYPKMPKAKEQKQITISNKRQVTIPKQFYDELGLTDEVVCEVRGNELVLKKIPTESDFSEEILRDLINEGYDRENLLEEFHNRKAQIRPALESLIEEAREEAKNIEGNGDAELDELFADLEE